MYHSYLRRLALNWLLAHSLLARETCKRRWSRLYALLRPLLRRDLLTDELRLTLLTAQALRLTGVILTRETWTPPKIVLRWDRQPSTMHCRVTLRNWDLGVLRFTAALARYRTLNLLLACGPRSHGHCLGWTAALWTRLERDRALHHLLLGRLKPLCRWSHWLLNLLLLLLSGWWLR